MKEEREERMRDRERLRELRKKEYEERKQ